MIVRLWFRKGGASDGLWWTAEIDGVEWHCSDVVISAPSTTKWEQRPGTPRGEQRHFIQAEPTSFHWDGARLVLNGPDDADH